MVTRILAALSLCASIVACSDTANDICTDSPAPTAASTMPGRPGQAEAAYRTAKSTMLRGGAACSIAPATREFALAAIDAYNRHLAGGMSEVDAAVARVRTFLLEPGTARSALDVNVDVIVDIGDAIGVVKAELDDLGVEQEQRIDCVLDVAQFVVLATSTIAGAAEDDASCGELVGLAAARCVLTGTQPDWTSLDKVCPTVE